MIDIHTHVLPGLDDGPTTLDEAAEMVRIAARAGTTDIVATPHSNLRFTFDPDRIAQALGELRTALGETIRLYTGCELHLTPETLQDALTYPTRYTLNQGSYLLVELDPLGIMRSVGDILDSLRSAGMTPVITHPERNRYLQNALPELENWVGRGCAIQVTGQALLGRFGQRARHSAEQLMRRELVHFIASDAHDAKRRSPALDDCYRHVAQHYGERCAQVLFVDNPAAALEGRPIDVAGCSSPRKRRWWPF